MKNNTDIVPMIKIIKGKKYYYKLSKNQRWQHMVLLVTFVVCVITGMPLKYAFYDWSKTLMSFMGGYAGTGLIHRISGVTMMLLFVYHLFYIIFQIRKNYVKPAKAVGEYSVKKMLRYVYYSPVFPRFKDLVDIKDMFKYYLFLSDKPPRHERFYWREKLDYLAVFWGINVLGITGIILWNKGFFMAYLPSWAISVSTIAHSFEALLATADIIIWHMYNAHVNYDKFPASDLFLTGYMAEDIMKHEYILEYKRINKLVEENPALIFNKDEYDRQENERNIAAYEDMKTYVEQTAANVAKPKE